MGGPRAGREDRDNCSKKTRATEAIRRELKALFKDSTAGGHHCRDAATRSWPAVAPTLTRGVFMGSPVFDGSRESEIKALLEHAGLPDIGQDVRCTTA